MLRWPIQPIRALGRTDLPPESDTALYEPKFDGFRALAWLTRDGVRLQSRHGRDLSRFFPDVCSALSGVPTGSVIDGELISWDGSRGRSSFSQLQRRFTVGRGISREASTRPAHFVAFDLLHDGRRELTDKPLSHRRRRLQRLLADAPPQLTLCPQTRDVRQARLWFEEMPVAGVEGLVVKNADGLYRAGRADWTKVKVRESAEYVIGGITGTIDQPGSLLLGRFDGGGTLRYLAQTHRLRAGQRRELGGLRPMAFQGPGSGHPWPCPLPGAWSVDLTDRQPVPYTPVEPTLVAEVTADIATTGPFARPRHRTTLLRTRPDLLPEEIATV